jgi:hypothetical protein
MAGEDERCDAVDAAKVEHFELQAAEVKQHIDRLTAVSCASAPRRSPCHRAALQARMLFCFMIAAKTDVGPVHCVLRPTHAPTTCGPVGSGVCAGRHCYTAG